MQLNVYPRRGRLLLVGTLFLLVVLPHTWANSQVQRPDQRKCIDALNKNFAKVAKTQGKDIDKCIKDGSKDKLENPTIEACLTADNKEKVSKAKGKTVAAFDSKCDDTPDFGPSDPNTVNQAAVDKELDLIHQIFGSDLDDAIVKQGDPNTPNAKDTAKCQIDVAKAAKKCQGAKLKAFNKCKKAGLKAESITGASGLEGCMNFDGDSKVAKACVEKLDDKISKKCPDSVDLPLAFQGCDTDDAEELRTCIDVFVECAVCSGLNEADGLERECDLFDDGFGNGSCGLPPILQKTVDIPSDAKPDETPGSPGVAIDPNSSLLTQFSDPNFDLNNARYTRYHVQSPSSPQPDAILILIPGFEGGASNFKMLAENLIRRALEEHGSTLEVWAVDRRSNQLEDLAGLDIAEDELDPQIGLDWLFGGELGLSLHPALASGPNRRAVFHNTSDDIPFFANWTPLVFSHDIDAVVEAALSAAADANVFLGGHSAGTGFTARYAATNFDLSGAGPAEPGYVKLRGLVLLDGGGGSTAGDPPTEAELDQIEDRFDGGLFNAVKSGVSSCVDGTPCDPNNPVSCAGKGKGTCTETGKAYTEFADLLNAHILASVEMLAIQGATDPDTGQNLLRVDQKGILDNNAIDQVPELATLAALDPSTVQGGIGSFVDDDGLIAGFASFLAMSVGAKGPTVNGLTTWIDITEDVPASAFTDNGPAPTSLPAGHWGVEKEPTSFDRLMGAFYVGGTNFTDWYYPSSGLSVTSGLPSLDSSALSLDPNDGRGRRDIENITQAANIDIPVIAFGGSNGSVVAPGEMVPFASSIGTCTAPSCDSFTPRVVDPNSPNEAFPTLGGVAGGFEVHISEGFSHLDVLTAEDNADNNVIGPLLDFIQRNLQ
jgi:pimeloyl-ACP methyl ester carboxylesterase